MDSQAGRLVKMDQSEHMSTVSQIILLIIVSSVIAIISLVTIFFTVNIVITDRCGFETDQLEIIISDIRKFLKSKTPHALSTPYESLDGLQYAARPLQRVDPSSFCM